MLRIVYSSCFRTIWTDKPVYPDPQDISYIVDGCYAAGYYPANYPAPAIPNKVYIKRSFVVVKRTHDNKALYRYLKSVGNTTPE